MSGPRRWTTERPGLSDRRGGSRFILPGCLFCERHGARQSRRESYLLREPYLYSRTEVADLRRHGPCRRSLLKVFRGISHEQNPFRFILSDPGCLSFVTAGQLAARGNEREARRSVHRECRPKSFRLMGGSGLQATFGELPIRRRPSNGRSGDDRVRRRHLSTEFVGRSGMSEESVGRSSSGEIGRAEVVPTCGNINRVRMGALSQGSANFATTRRPSSADRKLRGMGAGGAYATHIAKYVTVADLPLPTTGGPKIPVFC